MRCPLVVHRQPFGLMDVSAIGLANMQDRRGAGQTEGRGEGDGGEERRKGRSQGVRREDGLREIE